MKKSLISLSRNRTNNNINLFLSTRREEKKPFFKTTQEEPKTVPKIINQYIRGLKKKEVNVIFSVKNYDRYIKTKYNNDFSTKFLLIDDSDSKITSPISNTIRYNHSIQRFKHNNYVIRKYKESTSYSGYDIIKLNKPYLLNVLKDKSIKSLRTESTSRKIKNFIKNNKNKLYSYNNYTINHKTNQIHSNKNLSAKKDKIFNLKELYQFTKNNDCIKINTQRNNSRPKKLEKFRINFPIEFPGTLSFDKMELRDKVYFDYYDSDENIKKKIRKTLDYEINSFDYDNGIYSEYKKSIPNYINFIYDINIIPHLKNKFLYNRPFNTKSKINDIVFSRNAISKEVAYALNRLVINNIRKEIIEKEEREKMEKKLKDFMKSNKLMIKLYLERKDEDLPELTSGERVELDDFFGKNIDYKCVSIASNKLKKVAYEENNYFKKKNKEKY